MIALPDENRPDPGAPTGSATRVGMLVGAGADGLAGAGGAAGEAPGPAAVVAGTEGAGGIGAIGMFTGAAGGSAGTVGDDAAGDLVRWAGAGLAEVSAPAFLGSCTSGAGMLGADSCGWFVALAIAAGRLTSESF